VAYEQPISPGTPRDGDTLTATRGAWNGTPPITYTYQWQRCDTGSCTNIAGATEPTHTLQAADVDATLQVVVTATNAAGNASATSEATATITAAAPLVPEKPIISGTPLAGNTPT